MLAVARCGVLHLLPATLLYLLYLDDLHLDDLLFSQALGRMLLSSKRPVVLVHGSGGGAERQLEAAGYFPDRQDGRFVGLTPGEQRLVEQGYRQTNRALTMKLTDAGVSAVGVHGGDRALLRRRDDGGVEAGEAQWLRTLVASKAVPVVSALVAGPDGPEPADVAACLSALARALAPATVVLLTRDDRPGLGDPPFASLSSETLGEYGKALADPEAARRLAEAGVTLLVSAAPAFFGAETPAGTRIVTRNAV